MLAPEEYLDAIRRDGHALVDAAERAGMVTSVHACPEWDVADLVWHTGEVHQFWRTIAAERLRSPHDVAQPERPAREELGAWYRDGVERLHATLAEADPGAEVWTWAPQHDVAFIQRRMAQETAMHRYDAEHAAGASHAVETGLALDGVDEFLTFFLPVTAATAAPLAGSVHLHAIDGTTGAAADHGHGAGRRSGAGEWSIIDVGGDLVVRTEHSKGDVAVRGAASDLLLLLWGRLAPAEIEVFGDVAVLDRFLTRADLC